MGYTKTQLKQAMQAKRDLVKEFFKSHPLAMILRGIAILGVAAGISAGIGALASLALSAISLPPLIAGGIIGSAVLLVSIITKLCCDFQITTETDMSEEHKRVLREYYNSTEYKVGYYVKDIISIGVAFGIGAGLVALGFTSPAAIGALTYIAGAVACIPLKLLTDKVIECFFPEGSKQPDSLVDSDVKVAGGPVLSPSH
ncbi:hypothetical protein NOX90_00190 [Wolbachia endosymbiont of Anurida maritima]|uniref:hypothetical protein n=1 Tax=Wolbachia endosymbiont of Anurida maritima TaxID=2850562 RepID=UPI0035D02929